MTKCVYSHLRLLLFFFLSLVKRGISELIYHGGFKAGATRGTSEKGQFFIYIYLYGSGVVRILTIKYQFYTLCQWYCIQGLTFRHSGIRIQMFIPVRRIVKYMKNEIRLKMAWPKWEKPSDLQFLVFGGSKTSRQSLPLVQKAGLIKT